MSLETFEQMRSIECKLSHPLSCKENWKVSGDMSIAMKLQSAKKLLLIFFKINNKNPVIFDVGFS